jgi:transcriptional regulator with XRE-family HTH domain
VKVPEAPAPFPPLSRHATFEEPLAITCQVMACGAARRYGGAMNSPQQSVGELLRIWRRRRRLSQLHLATDAEISQRHLSFVESGRSNPSREMLLHLAERLDIPLRDRNVLLVAAGFAPVYGERSLEDPAFEAARRVIDMILGGHEPYPDGLAPRIANFREWRAHVLARLGQQVDASADGVLMALMNELKHYPGPDGAKPPLRGRSADYAGLAVPLELVVDEGVLSFISTTTVFGTPVDILLSEIAVESFFPADAMTAAAHRMIDINAGKNPVDEARVNARQHGR